LSSDDEVTPVAKLSFVPALNLTEVKKKRDETGGKKEEKKGRLLGTYPILPLSLRGHEVFGR
jgi:hypothetical protein